MDNSHIVNIFFIDEQRYALSIEYIKQVIRAVEVTLIPTSHPAVYGIIDYHGTILPVMNLRYSLGLKEKKPAIDDRFLIVETSKRTLVIVADSVGEIQNLSKQNILHADSIMNENQLLQMVRLEQGIVFIYDLERIFHLEDPQLFATLLESALNEREIHD
jgi:chemotaxis signal transduction protein